MSETADDRPEVVVFLQLPSVFILLLRRLSVLYEAFYALNSC